MNDSRVGSVVQIQVSSWQLRLMCSGQRAHSVAHGHRSVPVRPVAVLGQPAPAVCETPPVHSGGHWHGVLRYQGAHEHHHVRVVLLLRQSVHPLVAAGSV